MNTTVNVEHIPPETLHQMVDLVSKFKETSHDMRLELNQVVDSINAAAQSVADFGDIKSADINWLNKLLNFDESGEALPKAVSQLFKRLFLLKIFLIANSESEKPDTRFNNQFAQEMNNSLMVLFDLSKNMNSLIANQLHSLINNVIDRINDRDTFKTNVFEDIANIDNFTSDTPRQLFVPIATYAGTDKPEKKQMYKNRLQETSKKHGHVSTRIDEFVDAGQNM